MPTNPLVRTPVRELRRHAVPIGVGALALVVVLFLGIATAGKRATPQPEVPSVEPTPSATASASASDTQAPTSVTRTLTRECPEKCTLVFTATGGADTQLTISHVGDLEDSHPLTPDGASSRIQVTGTGSFQATATASDWVDLSAEPVP